MPGTAGKWHYKTNDISIITYAETKPQIFTQRVSGGIARPQDSKFTVLIFHAWVGGGRRHKEAGSSMLLCDLW